MKIYKKITRDFTVCSNNILRNKNLSLKAIGLYLYIINKPNAWNFSVNNTALQVTDGKDSIRTAVKELEKAGFLKREKVKKNNGKFNNSIWFIFDKPSENPTVNSREGVSEQPLTEKPSTEKPSAENPTQVNTNIVNTNKVNTHLSFTQMSEKENKEKKLTIRDVDTSPNPSVTFNENKQNNVNEELNEYLQMKQNRKTKKTTKVYKTTKAYKPYKVRNNILDRTTGLEISLTDNVDENKVSELATKYGLTTQEVLSCKEDYIIWVKGSSWDPKVWGKDMFIYVDRFCKQKASKAKKKNKTLKELDYTKKKYSCFNEMYDDALAYFNKRKQEKGY